jgi:ATP-binding cassette subfamily B multidrug efflux pump
MNIHTEKDLKNVKDLQLLTRLLSYAKPYWKNIMLCMLLALLIVVGELAKPYIIKIVIDDRINGLHQPMIAAPVQDEEKLAAYGDTVIWEDIAYVRLSEKEKGAYLAAPAADVLQRQIVEVDNKEWMIEGWLAGDVGSSKPALEQLANGDWRLTLSGTVHLAVSMDSDATKLFRDQDYRGFISLGLLFLLTVVGASVLSFIQSNLLQYTGQSIIFHIREQLFKHLSRMSMSFYDRNPVGRMVVRVTSDTESLNQLYSQVVVNLVKDVFVLIGIIIIMLQLSFKLTMLAFAVLPVLILITFWYKSVIREAQRNSRILLSRLNAFLAENLSGMRITQLFTREERQREHFDKVGMEHYVAGMRGTTINSIFQPAIGFLGNVAVALLLWYGGMNVLDGAISFGVVYAFTHYIRQFFQPLMSLAEKYSQIQAAMVGAERIFELLDEKPAVEEAQSPKRLPSKVKGEIVFEHVWFAYQDEEWVLKDVSFRIEPGQTVAFVGATGAGKSSIIQLINRFYDIQKGRITIDGIDIRDIPLDQLRHTVSIVQQDVFLFSGDLASNIRLQEHHITDEQVKEAARKVHMDEFIEKQPMGYGTLLGERGINLSLGQRQLLSFARAIVFRPQILILDEATSNIDTETELIVQDALHTISEDRTTVIVAHRLSTIQHADQIIVMHKGKVRESGNHFSLLAQQGYYNRLFEMQYKEEKPVRQAK